MSARLPIVTKRRKRNRRRRGEEAKRAQWRLLRELVVQSHAVVNQAATLLAGLRLA